jgi:antiviral helicase SLH1
MNSQTSPSPPAFEKQFATQRADTQAAHREIGENLLHHRIIRKIPAMTSSIETAQAQWLEQLAAMRKAIAELNLPADADKAPAYGDDLEFDDDDFSGTASGDDIWDIISDEYEEEYSSDQLDQFDQLPDAPSGGNLYDQRWLTQKCAGVAQRSSGLNAEALKDQILAILSSDSNGEQAWFWK